MSRRPALDEERLRARVLHVAAENPALPPTAIARIVGCSHVTARRLLRLHGVERQVRPEDAPPRGHVEAALRERAAPSKPLVVETLEQKLARLVPGAILHDSQEKGVENRWEVLGQRNGRLVMLAVGTSAREAVDRAVFLWGGR